MRTLAQRCFLCLLLLFVAGTIGATAAPAPASTATKAAIQSVLDAQVEAWNRGDITTFMQGYNDSPSTTFVGKTVQHGYAEILARYQKSFAGKEKMGLLNFSDIEINTVDSQVATVTGHFHLARTTAGGGDASGVFSLIFQKTKSGWKIILDHTCS